MRHFCSSRTAFSFFLYDSLLPSPPPRPSSPAPIHIVASAFSKTIGLLYPLFFIVGAAGAVFLVCWPTVHTLFARSGIVAPPNALDPDLATAVKRGRWESNISQKLDSKRTHFKKHSIEDNACSTCDIRIELLALLAFQLQPSFRVAVRADDLGSNTCHRIHYIIHHATQTNTWRPSDWCWSD